MTSQVHAGGRVLDPPACAPPVLWGDLVRRLAASASSTPLNAALSVVLVFGLGTGLASLVPVTVNGQDAAGAFQARCGLWYQLFSHPNPQVRSLCTAAYAGRALNLLIAAAVVFACSIALLLVSGPGSLWARSVNARLGTPLRAAAIAGIVSLLAVAGLALRVVTVTSSDKDGAFVARCGIGYYVSGAADPDVTRACRQVYRPQAVVFGTSLLAACVLVPVAWVARRRDEQEPT